MCFSLLSKRLYPKIYLSQNRFPYYPNDPWLGLYQDGELIARQVFPRKRFENGDEFQLRWMIVLT